MNDNFSSDEMLFDRLVDGELNADERRQLLVSLDDRPNGWRQCALAFLEAQTWRSDLGQVVRGASVRPAHKIAPRPAEEHRVAGRGALHWLATAAAVGLAFALGFLWQSSAGRHGADRNSAGGRIASVPGEEQSTGAENAAGTSRGSQDALTLWVRDEAGDRTPVHVPLVDASTLDRQYGVQFRSGVPESVREQLRRNGYHVESTRRYAPLWLDNGRSLVVPVEDTRIVPVSPVVY